MPAAPVFTKKENATLVQHIEMTSVMATVITFLQALTHERKSMVGQTGTTKMAKTSQKQLAILIQSTQTLKSNSHWFCHGLKKGLNGASIGNSQTIKVTGPPNELDRQSILRSLR